MKHLRIFSLMAIALVGVVTSCKDESIQLIPEWESGVHGLAKVTSANADFLYNTPATPVNVDLQWVSIDSKLSVTKIEVFVKFDENYVDADGNPAIAAHGGAGGKSFKVYEGSAVPANRTPLSFSLTQAELYTLYQSATFDYDGNSATAPTPVFTNPDVPARDATHRFYWEDNISLRWVFTTDDGRVFEKWGVSVCTEFPGANCAVALSVVCASEIEHPEGTWTFDMIDDYGDGWQNGYIGVWVDGVEVDKIFIPDSYNPASNPDIAAMVDTFTFPPGGQKLEFRWNVDDYQVETIFKIISPKGNVVADLKAGPPAGKIKLDLCLE